MEKMPQPKRETGDSEVQSGGLSRRNFLRGAGALAISASIPQMAMANVETSPRPLARPEREVDVVEEEIDPEIIKERVYESYVAPQEKALHFTSVLHNDLDLVTNRIGDLVEGEGKYSSALHLIHDELALANIPEPTQSALREMMMYVPYVESRFSNEAVSSVQAFGIMQLMPSVWEELSFDGEVRENLVNQVQVAGRLLEQTYRHIMNVHSDTVEIITNLLYDGDFETCAREFICPLVINGYFSGMGTINEVLGGFYKDYVNNTEKAKMAERGILEDELGVYGLFSTAGELHGYSKLYGKESGNYVPKILAAKKIIHEGLPGTLLAELVPGYNQKEKASS